VSSVHKVRYNGERRESFQGLFQSIGSCVDGVTPNAWPDANRETGTVVRDELTKALSKL